MIHHYCHEDIKLPIFSVIIDGTTDYWLNKSKTNEDFQRDMAEFVDLSKNSDEDTLRQSYLKFMEEEDYKSVSEMISGVFEAELVSTRARLIPTGDQRD
jgi:hypothetical protein